MLIALDQARSFLEGAPPPPARVVFSIAQALLSELMTTLTSLCLGGVNGSTRKEHRSNTWHRFHGVLSTGFRGPVSHEQCKHPVL